MAYTQENRLIAIDTPLGKDALLLAGFKGIEKISGLFSFGLNLLSENHNITFEDIIGKNVTVSIILADGDKRFFNGIISSFSQGRGGGEAGGDPHFSHYAATMVPWLWLLKRTADSRIFQKLSVPDIVEKIFTEKEFLDYKLPLNDSYDKRDYCVQYRETDFNFISRLLEEEGICYFFEHDEKKHTLILADASDKFKPCPKQESARYQISAGGWLEEDVITSLEKMQEIRPAKYSINDFNFEIPGTDMKVDVSTKQMLGPGEREIYDYPGLYTKKAQGERLTTIRMEEEETKITTITGSSDCRAFTSGYRFDLLEYFREDMNNKPYVMTSVNHGATEPVGGSGQESGQSYANSFTCIPFDVPYRPPRLTPKPVVEGAQTAIVVGPAGEEIYPDEHGRVKVQFHWDREGTNDENSSCWIRVSQVWAGAGWGAMHIPRIDQEVIVNFLEGDPDRPIITGRVYHGTNSPPYSLPDEKTKSTIKSNTSLGGGSANELLMEDLNGKTQVVLSNAYGHKITEDEETQTLTVETRDLNIIRMDDKNKNIFIQTTKAHKLLFDDENKKIVVNTTDGHVIEMDDENKKIFTKTKDGHIFLFDDLNKKIEIVSKDGHSVVLDDENEKMGMTSKKGHAITIDDSGESITLEDSGGVHRFKIDISGDTLLISTDSGAIDIEAPSGKISLKATEIEIDASTDLKLKGGMNVTSEAGVEHSTKGTMVSAEASATNVIKGALVQIN